MPALCQGPGNPTGTHSLGIWEPQDPLSLGEVSRQVPHKDPPQEVRGELPLGLPSRPDPCSHMSLPYGPDQETE